jgi:hypothetical protein
LLLLLLVWHVGCRFGLLIPIHVVVDRKSNGGLVSDLIGFAFPEVRGGVFKLLLDDGHYPVEKSGKRNGCSGNPEPQGLYMNVINLWCEVGAVQSLGILVSTELLSLR